MLLIEKFTGDFWKIVSLGTNPNDYTVSINQKIVQEKNWIFNLDGSAKNKDALLWNERTEMVIEFPENILMEEHKHKKLEECRQKILNNPSIIDKAVLKSIVTGIKSAGTIPEIDSAFKQLDNNIKTVLGDLGL